MSENKNYQIDIEKRCLEFVINNMNKEDCFGLSDKEYKELRKKLNEAKPNINNNQFPDFIFREGFIEHFAITSSFENKKGAEQKRESNIFNNKSKKDFLNEISEDNRILYKSYARSFEKHTHANIINSLKRNWMKHIKSYDKSTFLSGTRIFLIDYTDINIETAVTLKDENTKIFRTYRISADKELLKWIYSYKPKVDYLILVNLFSPSIEIIKIDYISQLIEEILDVKYASTIGMEIHQYINIEIEKKDFH